MNHELSCREWLRANGRVDVAELIDEVMEEWRLAGKRTRRNWWDILAGNKKGLGRIVADRVFPVLPEAIQRQTPHAAQINAATPAVRFSNRWPQPDPGALEVAD